MALMGRKSGSRRDKADKRKAQRLADLAARGLIGDDRGQPNIRVLARREAFNFVSPTKGPEGRVGTIDQDICDGIGQLHALGLLDGHGLDPQELRDKAREWGHGYAFLMRGQGIKVSKFERAAKGHKEPTYTKRDELFDLMDNALTGYERSVMLSLIVDPLIGDFAGEPVIPWAKSLIDEALLKRGKLAQISQPMRFPECHDRELLKAAIRGMVQLVDAALPQRRAA